MEGDDESFFDRFEIVVGEEVSKNGNETTEITFRLREDNLAANDTLYLTAERDVYEDINAGLRLLFRFQ